MARDSTLANLMRPRRFIEVVGQDSEKKVLTTILRNKWKPAALMVVGPFGTGKTTFSRLIARAMLCQDLRDGHEPCGECQSCKMMDTQNHPSYIEVDSASNGSVSNVREMLTNLQYVNGGLTIINYDESHMLSAEAQNQLLLTLEEGRKDVLWVFATTEAGKMLPTVASRCVQLKLKLLTVDQIYTRLTEVVGAKGFDVEPVALRVLATYAKGHMRDALMLLEQMVNVASKVTSDLVRTYLRLDKVDYIYRFLEITEKPKAVVALEELLCEYHPEELVDLLGSVLLAIYMETIGAYKPTSDADHAWIKRLVPIVRMPLQKSEKLYGLNSTYYSSIQATMSALIGVLFYTEETQRSAQQVMHGAPISSTPFRKPGK